MWRLARRVACAALAGVLVLASPLHAQPQAADESRLKEALEQASAREGASSDAANSARRELIRYYQGQYRPGDALPHLRAALAAAVARHGNDSPEAQELRLELGTTLVSLGYANEALEHLLPAYEAYRRQYGDDHPRTSNVLLGMGRAYLSAGRFDEAIAALRKAVAIRSRHFGPNHPRTGVAEYRLGQALWRSGRYAEAERVLRDALFALSKRGEDKLQYNLALNELGELYRATGRLNEAEEAQQKALAQQLQTAGPRHPSTLQIMESLGATLLDQRRYAEAEKVTRQALELTREAMGEQSQKVIGATMQLARIYQASGRRADAAVLLRQALSAREALHGADALPTAHARVRLAEALISLRQFSEAKPLLESALATYEKSSLARDSLDLANARWDLGRVHLATGAPGQAERWIGQALPVFLERKGEQHPATVKIRADLAEAQAKQGRTDEAFATYRQALASATGFLAARRTEVPEARAEQEETMRSMLSGYLNLAVQVRLAGKATGADPVAESFSVGETVRSRTLQQALLRMSARAAARDPRLAELVRTDQDLRLQLGSIEEGFVAAIDTGQVTEERGLAKSLVQRRREVEREIQSVGEEIRSRFPDYERLTNPPPATVAETRGVLGGDELLVSYLVEKNRTLLWAVRPDRAELHLVPIGAEELEKKVRQLRRSLDLSLRTLADLPPYAVPLAHELYRLLLGPVAPLVESSRHLILVPHGPLFSLPFPALITREAAQPRPEGIPFSEYRSLPWLAATHALSVMPSATALVTLRRHGRPAAAQESFLGFGDPKFNGVRQPGGTELGQRSLGDSRNLRELPQLPETAEELRTIAQALGADPIASVVTGEQASETAVKHSPLDAYRVVAFATHGLVSGDLEGLDEPALALAAPAAPSAQDDGLLTMSEVLGLKMNAQWVVLSACNTAAPDGSLRGEGLSGLAQAFFYAGSRALLVTLWAVETGSAKELTTALFRSSRKDLSLPRAEALAQARRQLIAGPGPMRDGKEAFSYAHPFFWAAFTLVGEGGQ